MERQQHPLQRLLLDSQRYFFTAGAGLIAAEGKVAEGHFLHRTCEKMNHHF